MSKRLFGWLLFFGIVIFGVYLASIGYTVNDVKFWIQRQLGIHTKMPDARSMPYTNYGPVVTPGR